MFCVPAHLSPPSHAASTKDKCKSLVRDIIGSKSSTDVVAVEKGSFVVRRSYTEINRVVFRGRLGRVLTKLRKSGGHWVDMGAGNGRVQTFYYKKHPDSKMRFTGVGYKLYTGWDGPTGRAVKASGGRYDFIEGWFTRETAARIGKVDLITDAYGIYYYTKPGKELALLDIYISMLKPDGKIMINADRIIKLDGWNNFLARHPDIKVMVRESGELPGVTYIEIIKVK
ncbi:MAG: hypothetical protein A2583_02295 [Bdellovibrionales bacterium RIFOXYD1_FULL_53_11]|nr:MAG: hypothetical protein A2583_02295 [Bdellovibrionales bacterium RIFOXYD1_FULL_53_11]